MIENFFAPFIYRCTIFLMIPNFTNKKDRFGNSIEKSARIKTPIQQAYASGQSAVRQQRKWAKAAD